MSVGTRDFELRADGTLVPIYAPLPDVEILPDVHTFSGEINIEMRCAEADVDIFYTLDGGKPTPASPRYVEPIGTRTSTVVRAQGFRAGVSQSPSTMHGTHATNPVIAEYEHTERLPDVTDLGHSNPEQGLEVFYYRCGWAGFRDLIAFPESQTPDTSGVCHQLFDISMRDMDEPCGFRYRTYLNASATGDYIFIAPDEYMDLTIDAGYDLTVSVDGSPWCPCARHHGYGRWSIGLEAGYHLLEVWFIDYRGDAQLLKLSAPRTEIHRVTFDRHGNLGPNFPQWPQVNDLIWTGVVPELKLMVPGERARAIPPEWLFRSE